MPNNNSLILSSTTVLRGTNQNVLVVGGACSGKTMTYVLPNLFQRNGSYVVIDQYDVIREKTEKMFKENGYQIRTFDASKTTEADVETFDVGSIGREPTVVYILTGFNNDVNATVVPPLLHKIMKECTTSTEIPVHILLDEFCNLGKIPEFQELLAASGPMVSCSIIIQHIQQLCCLYPETWTDIVGHCDAAVFLGCSDMNTLVFISSLNRYEMSPQTIERIAPDKCLVMIKGRPTLIDPKYDPFKTML